MRAISCYLVPAMNQIRASPARIAAMLRLRGTLALIVVAALALPLGGWQLVQQIEALLREGQEQAQIAAAATIARALATHATELPAAGSEVYAARLASAPLLDAVGSDWPEAASEGAIERPVTLKLGDHGGVLYALIDVRDPSRVRVGAGDPLGRRGDGLLLGAQSAAGVSRIALGNGADGALELRVVDDAGGVGVRGEWRDTATGYRVELALSAASPIGALALAAVDVDAAGTIRALAAPLSELSPVLRPDPALDQLLAALAPARARVRLVSGEGFVIARTGALEPSPGQPQIGAWQSRLYDFLLAPEIEDASGLEGDRDRLDSALVWQALTGLSASSVRPTPDAASVVVTAAVPVGAGSQPRGAVVLEQNSEALLVLANRAVFGVMAASLAAVLVSVLLLVLYAGRLSLRIRRLRNATERALPTDGRLALDLPHLERSDDLGDLARSFSRLLREVGGYNEYLKTLASKLSHELATPLAIVRSSLDNLEHETTTPAARKYAARAREGAERLAGILRAMSEANRMEHAIENAEGEDFDLSRLVRDAAESYRDLVAPRALELVAPSSALTVYGAPDLVAQALDKLIANARSFTQPNGWIRMRVRALEEGVEIAVDNGGPPLPEGSGERLFHSLVSVREATGGDAPHLGLGLVVVRLVAELHRGEASATNLADDAGVSFVLRLKGMARRR